MKTALVYDRVNKWGGAERVMLALHKIFPSAPLYTSVYDFKKAEWAKEFEIKTSFLQKFPHIVSNHELYPFLMPIAFEQFDFDEYDLVISVTSEAAKGIITKPGTKHICYCLTPTRYLWSGYDEYFKNRFMKKISQPFIFYLRKWDEVASNRPDCYIAASIEVKNRIKKFYHKPSEVVYPPIFLDDSKDNDLNKLKNNQYYLIVSRLVSVKRIDLAIKACNELKLPLKIIGTGKEENKLKKMSGPSISFVGNIPDSELINYYSNALGLICPGVEDFGLTIVEMQKFGKPVIAYRKGGALETIIEGKTGMFFNEQTKESLVQKLKEFENHRFNQELCKSNAERFNFNNFKKNFLSLVEKAI